MTESFADDWRKELRVLLDHIEKHPSEDLAEKRQRAVLLTKLIADHDAQARKDEARQRAE